MHRGKLDTLHHPDVRNRTRPGRWSYASLAAFSVSIEVAGSAAFNCSDFDSGSFQIDLGGTLRAGEEERWRPIAGLILVVIVEAS